MKQVKEECPRSGLVKQNEERHKLCLSGEKTHKRNRQL
jgi:hypothetical protein